MMKNSDEITQAGQDTIEALSKSAAAFADGLGEISRHVIEITQKSVAMNLAAGKEVFNVKAPADWIELQSKWAGDMTATVVTQMAHLSQLSTTAAHHVCEPLKIHFDELFGKMGSER